MLDRFMSLLKGMFNKGMEKMETPEVLAEQAEMELESNLKKLLEALTAGLTTEKMLEKEIQKNSQELSTYEQRALMAVQGGNDDLARMCLAKKQEFSQKGQVLDAQLIEQKKTNAALKSGKADLETKLREFKTKKSQMISRMQASDNATNANGLMNATPGTAFDKLERKIQEKEAMGQAMRELSGSSEADQQFKAMDKEMVLDDELAALKAKMGGGPKLIEAKDVEVIDENLPMVREKKPGES